MGNCEQCVSQSRSVAIEPFYNVQFGSPPTPESGIFNKSIMKGWDDFKNTLFTITHYSPFDIRLLGVFYKVDVGG